MSDQLSGNADHLLAQMYRHYLEQKAMGVAHNIARYMGESWQMMEFMSLNCTFDDLKRNCRELERGGWLTGDFSCGAIRNTILTDAAIKRLETRFSKGMKSVDAYFFARKA